ncbi:MAG: hypothetical protein AAB900_00475, partial [Patescibacteria group bacterium]
MALDNKTIHLNSIRSPGILPFLVALMVFGFTFSLGGNLGQILAPTLSPLGSIALQTEQSIKIDLNDTVVATDPIKKVPLTLKTVSPPKTLPNPTWQNWSDQVAGLKYAIFNFGDFLWQSSADWLSLKLDRGAGFLVRLWGTSTEAEKILPTKFQTEAFKPKVNILSVSDRKIRTWNTALNQVGSQINLALARQTQNTVETLRSAGAKLAQFVFTPLQTGFSFSQKIILTQAVETKSELNLARQIFSQSVLDLTQALTRPIKIAFSILVALPETVILGVANQSDRWLASGVKPISRSLA